MWIWTDLFPFVSTAQVPIDTVSSRLSRTGLLTLVSRSLRAPDPIRAVLHRSWTSSDSVTRWRCSCHTQQETLLITGCQVLHQGHKGQVLAPGPHQHRQNGPGAVTLWSLCPSWSPLLAHSILAALLPQVSQLSLVLPPPRREPHKPGLDRRSPM